MRTRIVCAVGVMLVCAGVTLADELTGVIYKVEGDKITFREGKKDAEQKTYDIAKDVKVYRIINKTQKELDPDGLKAEPLPNLPKAGAIARITIVDGKVTAIDLPRKPKKN